MALGQDETENSEKYSSVFFGIFVAFFGNLRFMCWNILSYSTEKQKKTENKKWNVSFWSRILSFTSISLRMEG